MRGDQQRLLAFYGDDFTGSTDALEFLSRSGARTVLFIEPPTKEQLAFYKDLDAFGVAGMTRALPPDEMEAILRPAFEQLARLDVQHVHYKVCSTFDSSPTIGSIGKAIDVGADVFKNRFVPLLVAAPPLGRYCVFGNLFARMGIGSNGQIYRLDRHPSMSRHPVTPADESDLRLHLSRQTSKKTGLLDILSITKTDEELRRSIEELMQQQSEVVLIDALYDHHLLAAGELLAHEASRQETLFSVGSSGIEMALGQYWNRSGRLCPVTSWPEPGKAEPLLVLSGSCSPVSTRQIAWALHNGFAEVRLNAKELIKARNDVIQSCIEETRNLLQQGQHVVVHASGETATGTKPATPISAALLGTALGKIARGAIAATGVKRISVAGGDTSSYAARAMGIEAVEVIAPLVSGAPLCKAFAPGSPVDGREVNFKGGQVGDETYFGGLAEGKVRASTIKNKLIQ